jgi:hypothetical protein
LCRHCRVSGCPYPTRIADAIGNFVIKKSNNSGAHDRMGQKNCFSKNAKIACELRIKPNDIVTAREGKPPLRLRLHPVVFKRESQTVVECHSVSMLYFKLAELQKLIFLRNTI